MADSPQNTPGADGGPPPPPAADPLHDPHAQEWERTYAMFEHLSLVAAHIIPIVPALVLWLIKRDQSPFVDDHGKESLNFQISLILYIIVGIALTPACGVGAGLIGGAYVLGIVGMILAAIAAHKGRYYRYPMCLRFVK